MTEWQRLSETIERLKGVKATAPASRGAGSLSRGAKSVSSIIVGIVPSQHLKVESLDDRVVEGRMAMVDQLNAAIGIKMAADLGQP